MKKWFFPFLLAALLLAATGCDETDTPPFELPDTVDGLTVVTSEEIDTDAEPVTDAVTDAVTDPESESEAATEELPSEETEALSAEEAAALLKEILQKQADNAEAPVEIHMTSEAELTAHMFGFSGTTVIPLSGYYAIDRDGELMLSYAIPMEGTGVYIVTDEMLYLHDGTDTALKAPLDEASLVEVKTTLFKQFADRLENGIPGMTLPETEGISAEGWSLPSSEPKLSTLLHQIFSAVPVENAFRSVTAVRSLETGAVTITLSGISESVLNALEGLLTVLPAEQPVNDAGAAFTEETAAALIALLREQSENAVVLTLTADSDSHITEVSSSLALDLSPVPELTSHMPVEMAIRTTVTYNRAGIDISAPEDADTYREVTLKELLTHVEGNGTEISEETQAP